MGRVSANVLATIGNSSLVELRRVVPKGCAKIFVKVEGENPTGSMKDRMAQAVIETGCREPKGISQTRRR